MKPTILRQRKTYFHYTIALTGQDDKDWQACRKQFSGVDIVRIGIKEALKKCPKK